MFLYEDLYEDASRGSNPIDWLKAAGEEMMEKYFLELPEKFPQLPNGVRTFAEQRIL